MDYAIPKADQLPPLAVVLDEHPSTINALGIKGVGERRDSGPRPSRTL
jgi:CO/xanthine dehydrogenase Mo-binding subunit